MSTTNGAIYIRSGSNNVPAPYAVIAGMFGRRPQPNVELIIANKYLEALENVDEDMLYPKSIDNPPEKYIKIGFAVQAANNSNVIAREIYLTCRTESTSGEYNKVRFLNYNQMDSIPGIEGQLNLITRPELRLPPRGIIKFCNVEIILSPLIDEDLMVDGVIGADECAPKDFRIHIPKNRLRSFVAKALRDDDGREALINEFFGEFLINME